MPRAIVGGITRKLEKPQLAERSAVPPITDSAAHYEAVIRLVRSTRDLFHQAALQRWYSGTMAPDAMSRRAIVICVEGRLTFAFLLRIVASPMLNG
jgi:hypothetical protein